ncbi:glycoside hydrolase family 3 N-terminal domain-containing protein [Dinoroseobacter sp. PD6]|uniref:glycoside hydrolase family 3 N-terminal domain-containing protein n=1 Tax=Dinoroseobacter sp. PD6 TaxID=3028384 RepID=UPI00237ABA61|nr:glycoside hydrolase family 3 N-terminal domain-containing protein [Dinoroseobacter sp. PD6]MDD9715436.1 glycoside hydrolase family 3 N-terminal domain-containing protein [Dinoroseobacter sp. PD6]
MAEPRRAAILGCGGPVLTPEEAAFFAAANPWGFILFGRNVESRAQLARLTADLRAALGWHAPILIDQEGGRVARMAPPEWRGFPPALDQAASARAFWVRGRAIALDLAEVGIDVNCAPLADIALPETHPILRNRCYGTDAATVVANARAMADGLRAGGVLPILKHLPGYGRGTVDSHKALPRVAADAATLRATDFAPFVALCDMAMGMTAHLVYEAFDPDLPATVSPRMIDLIRTEIGFDGLLMTDDISMEALSGTVPERGQAALAAGCDLVLHCNGDLAEMQALAAALPPMTEAAQTRAARALAQRQTPQPVDIPALDAERNALPSA